MFDYFKSEIEELSREFQMNKYWKNPERFTLDDLMKDLEH